jgi:hypothetical protein
MRPRLLIQALHKHLYVFRPSRFQNIAMDVNAQRAKGKRRNTAIRALAFKWIRILFRLFGSVLAYALCHNHDASAES